MEEFFDKIPLGYILPGKDHEEIILTENIDAVVEKKKEDHQLWREMEMNLQFKVIHQQLKLITDLMPAKPLPVPRNLWGHRSRAWPGSRKMPPSYHSRKPSTRSPKPFSIPFCPKPVHLLARKAYLRPPPKLPPLTSKLTSKASLAPLQLNDSSLEFEEVIDDALFKELFADAIERAKNSEKTARHAPADSWADHCYFDDLDTDQGDDGQVPPADEPEIPWEYHQYYNDLDSCETVSCEPRFY